METKKKMTKNLKLMLFGATLSVILCFAVIASFPTVKVKTAYSLTPVPNTAITPTALKPYVLETPFSSASYIFQKYANGSYYGINCSNWDNFAVAASPESMVDSAVSALEDVGGIIHFGAGDFNVSILLIGDDSYGLEYQHTIIIEGEGIGVTNLTNPVLPVINVTNAASFVIRDLTIDYGSNDGLCCEIGSYSPNAPKSKVENVEFVGGSGDVWAIDWVNPNTPSVRDVLIQAYGAGGIHLKQTSAAANFGNFVFDGNILVNLHANNSIGLLIDNSGARSLNMVNSFGYFEVAPQGAFTNTTGIWVKMLRYSTFEGIEVEGCVIGLSLDACADCWFGGGRLYSYVSDTFLTMTANSYQNMFNGFYLAGTVNYTAFEGGTGDNRYNNTLADWLIEPNSCNANSSVAAGTVVRDILKSDVAGGTFVGFSP